MLTIRNRYARAAAQVHLEIIASLAAVQREDPKQLAEHKILIDKGFQQIDRCIARLEATLRLESQQPGPGRRETREAELHQQHLDLMKSGAEASRREWTALSSSLQSRAIPQIIVALAERVDVAIRLLLETALDYQGGSSAETRRVVGQEHERAEYSVKLLAIVALAAIGLALLLGWSVAAQLAKRLARMKEATGKIGDGNLEDRVDVGTADEIGQFASAFNDMAERLRCRGMRSGRCFAVSRTGRGDTRNILDQR